MLRKIILFSCMVWQCALLAQIPETIDSIASQQALQAVTVHSTRLPLNELRSPVALTVLSKDRLQTAQQLSSMYEPLAAVPGVFVQNAENLAQDLRLSIRGFGARAQFGVRGIKIITDGIPESTPDGQVKLGSIDPAWMERMEVIRGPSAALWGNASGGVISFSSENSTERPTAQVQLTAGEYGFSRLHVKGGQKVKLGEKHLEYLVSGGRIFSEGYRGFSQSDNTLASGKFKLWCSDRTQLSVLYNFNSLEAQDPGGITESMVAADRRQPRLQNVQFDAGTQFQQQRFALVFHQKFGKKENTIATHELDARIFHTNRNFSNRLAFLSSGMIAFQRDFSGGGANYRYSRQLRQWSYRSNLGVEIEHQADERQRFDNKNGLKGNKTLEQTEIYQAMGGFWLHELSFQQKLTLTVGTRFDQVRTEAVDKFLSDGNQSGDLTFKRFSPSMGLSVAVVPTTHVYANYSTGFETPTLNELSNNPNNTGGFNAALTPMYTQNYELGTKSSLGLQHVRLRLEAALFQVWVKDELVTYQLPAFPGKNFYRNAGNTERKGIELGVTTYIQRRWTTVLNYTYSDFKYKNYTTVSGNFAGKVMPGIPKHTVYAEIRYFAPQGWYISGQYRYADTQFGDDANTVTATAYNLVNFRAGYAFKIANTEIEPFLGVNNAANRLYSANVQLNALGGRFFEPSSGRTIFGGIKCALH